MRGYNSVVSVLMVFVLCFERSYQEKTLLHINESAAKILAQQAEICGKELGIPADTMDKVLVWSLPNDDVSKKFLYCVDYNTGHADKNGYLIAETFLAMQFVNGSREEVANRIKYCNKITKENHFETLYAAGECIAQEIVWSV